MRVKGWHSLKKSQAARRRSSKTQQRGVKDPMVSYKDHIMPGTLSTRPGDFARAENSTVNPRVSARWDHGEEVEKPRQIPAKSNSYNFMKRGKGIIWRRFCE